MFARTPNSARVLITFSSFIQNILYGSYKPGLKRAHVQRNRKVIRNRFLSKNCIRFERAKRWWTTK